LARPHLTPLPGIASPRSQGRLLCGKSGWPLFPPNTKTHTQPPANPPQGLPCAEVHGFSLNQSTKSQPERLPAQVHCPWEKTSRQHQNPCTPAPGSPNKKKPCLNNSARGLQTPPLGSHRNPKPTNPPLTYPSLFHQTLFPAPCQKESPSASQTP